MKIIFLQDFQGVETGGVFYKRDQIVDLDINIALRLIADKRATPMEVPVYEQPAKQVVADDSEIFGNVYIEPQPTAKIKRGRK